MRIKQLDDLARRARRDFETGTIPPALLRKLYLNYNPTIIEIDKFLKQADKFFPVGNCGLATIYLREILGDGQIMQGCYQDKPHTFLLFKELILDIAVDQFGGPAVSIGNFTEPWTIR